MNRPTVPLTHTALLAASFFLLASASIALTRFDGGAAFLWPATAPLLAFLTVRHPRDWLYPMLATGIASWTASSLFGLGPVVAIPLAFAIVGEGVISALILRAAGDDLSSFDNLPSLAIFVVAAGIVAPALSGVVGAAAIAAHTGFSFWSNWRAWFAAHGLGTLSIAPLLLLFLRGEGRDGFRTASLWRKLEAIALLIVVAATAFAVFDQQRYPLLFLPLLPLLVTTFRLGRLGAAGSVILLAAIGGALTLRGHGPINLIAGSVGSRVQFFQAYLAVAVMIVLPAAAELRRRDALAVRIRQSEAAYRLLAENLGDTLIHTSLEGEVRYASPEIVTLTGYDAGHVIGRNSRDFVFAEDFDVFKHARDEAIGDPDRSINVEYRARLRDDVIIWCETRMRSYTNAHGVPVGIILVVRDVTTRKAAEAELALDAITDALTGLPNRRAFFNRLTYLQSEIASGQAAGCVAIFDIDHFKRVNDAHGHIAGDNVLRSVAAAASMSTRSGDLVARVGGEEFAIVLWGATMDAATQTCERVRAEIEAGLAHAPSGAAIRVTASFGVARIDAASPTDGVYEAADRALYAAKAAGRNRLRIAS